MNSLVYYSQTCQCFDFENLLYHGFCHSPRVGFLLLLGIKTKIPLSESIFKSSQCQVASKKVYKNSCCRKTSLDSISYQHLWSINQSETQVAYARKGFSNPDFYYCSFYYEDKRSYYHLK